LTLVDLHIFIVSLCVINKSVKKRFSKFSALFRKRRIPYLLRNRYFISSMVLFIWLLFFDSNNLISQVQLRYEIWKLDQKATYYKEELLRIKEQRAELLKGPESLEKFARETYKMKRDNEDLYLIIQE
jgi:cell division protein DivIC